MRKNKLQKTSKPNIYEIVSHSERIEYIVRFSYLGKSYGQRNFTKLFGCNTLKQTFDKFNEVKIELSKGNNPFKKKVSISLNSLWDERRKELKEGDHKYVLSSYYKKHIEPIIGKMDIDEVDEKHLYRILNGTLKESGSSNRMKLKTILNPIFRKSIKKELIKNSPLEYIKFEKLKFKEELSSILVNDYKIVSQKLYKGIKDLREDGQKYIEYKLSMYFGLMTVRRRSEILKYKHSNIIDGKLFVPSEYTKINKTDEFPLSEEMLELINKLPKDRDELFTINRQTITKRFNKVVKDCNIQLTKGNTFTFHQCRNLFQSIMIPQTSNPPLVDRCLSHTQNNVMSIYLSFEYKNRKEVFEEYWDILRG